MSVTQHIALRLHDWHYENYFADKSRGDDVYVTTRRCKRCGVLRALVK